MAESSPTSPALCDNATESPSSPVHVHITTTDSTTENASAPTPTSSEAPNVLGKRKSAKPPSLAWLHFTKVNGRAQCNYCKKTYACDSDKNGTSNLNKHIEFQCLRFPGRESKQKTLLFQPLRGGDVLGSKISATSYSPAAIRRQIASYIITEELPFRHVESDGFRDLLGLVEPRFNVPSRMTVTRDALLLHKTERIKLKKILVSDHQRVCLTTDTWTSIQNLNYMCLTAHYIDSDWRYRKRIISFCQVEDHRGETLGKQIETCLLSWGIVNVLTVTVDNASANDKAVSFLEKIVNNWKGSIMSSKHMHMRCCAHILNLVVSDGLKDYHVSVNRIRDVVRHWRGSPARMMKFKACVEKQKITSKALLCLDVSTRWNSTYLMLEAAVKFETVFTRLADEDGQFVREFYKASGTNGEVKVSPTPADWDNARALVKFLKVFYDATVSFSGSSFATSNNFLWELVIINAQIQTWTSSKDPFLKTMGDNMKRKYDKYWGGYRIMNPFLFVAHLLDPRHKEFGLHFCLEQLCGKTCADELVNEVKDVLMELYAEYKLLYPNVESAAFSQEQTVVSNVVDNDVLADMNSLYEQRSKAQVGECKTEVDQYLMEAKEPKIVTFDIFSYWRSNSGKYPLLSHIARDILAIPVSTVASESTFSTGGRVLDSFRSSLAASTVEALVCTQNWLRSDKKIDLLKLLEDTKEIEAEILADSTGSTSENMVVDVDEN